MSRTTGSGGDGASIGQQPSTSPSNSNRFSPSDLMYSGGAMPPGSGQTVASSGYEGGPRRTLTPGALSAAGSVAHGGMGGGGAAVDESGASATTLGSVVDRLSGQFAAASLPVSGDPSRRTSYMAYENYASGHVSGHTSPFSQRSMPMPYIYQHFGGGSAGGAGGASSTGENSGSHRSGMGRRGGGGGVGAAFSPSTSAMDMMAAMLGQGGGAGGSGTGGDSGPGSPFAVGSPSRYQLQVQPSTWEPSRGIRGGSVTGRRGSQVSLLKCTPSLLSAFPMLSHVPMLSHA